MHLPHLGISLAAALLMAGMSARCAWAADAKAGKVPSVWAERAITAQEALDQMYWDPEAGLYTSRFPGEDESDKPFNYWWQAHCIDALLDAYKRTKDPALITRVDALIAGVLRRNGGSLHNDFYDDMEWMALAFLRAYDLTGKARFAELAKDLWKDIKGGWNKEQGGGIAWRKSQPDYKNAPANGPAAILGARLYQRFKDKSDLDLATNIMVWMKANLVNPKTGQVWDGKNRQGDGKVDKDWKFTYCQGVYIGACVELNAISKDKAYLEDAYKTAKYAMTSLADSKKHILQGENGGDGGLFKGILVRYMVDMAVRNPAEQGSKDIKAFLEKNGESAWTWGNVGGLGLIGPNWAMDTGLPVDLSCHLSGVMLFEGLDLLDGK